MRRSAFLPAGALGIAMLAGCSPLVDVPSASQAADPRCADVMVSLPETVADFPARETNSQATAAWGDPSKVIVRCGVAPPGPTTDRCVGVEEVDWVLREGEDAWTFTTYGRAPAIEVLFNPDQVASSTVLVDLAPAVRQVPQTDRCLGPGDLGQAEPSPPPG